MQTCGSCAWFDGRGCIGRVAYGAPPFATTSTSPACERFEVLTSCDPCGACCREAFDAVPADGGDLPDTLTTVLSDTFTSVRRVPGCGDGTRCACLRGDGQAAPFRCTHYAVRPTACRDLELGSENCLLARRRIGLSPPAPRG